jgi:hypothetical protein
VSTSTLTIWAAVVAGVVVILLIILDPREPARRQNTSSRAPRTLLPPRRAARSEGVAVTETPTELYRSPRWWQRFGSIFAMGAIAFAVAAVAAVFISTVLVLLFFALNSFLKKS